MGIANKNNTIVRVFASFTRESLVGDSFFERSDALDLENTLMSFSYSFGKNGQLKYEVRLVNPNVVLEESLLQFYRELYVNKGNLNTESYPSAPKIFFRWGYFSETGILQSSSSIHAVRIIDLDYLVRENKLVEIVLIGADDFVNLMRSGSTGLMSSDSIVSTFAKDRFSKVLPMSRVYTNLLYSLVSKAPGVRLHIPHLSDFSFIDDVVGSYVSAFTSELAGISASTRSDVSSIDTPAQGELTEGEAAAIKETIGKHDWAYFYNPTITKRWFGGDVKNGLGSELMSHNANLAIIMRAYTEVAKTLGMSFKQEITYSVPRDFALDKNLSFNQLSNLSNPSVAADIVGRMKSSLYTGSTDIPVVIRGELYNGESNKMAAVYPRKTTTSTNFYRKWTGEELLESINNDTDPFMCLIINRFGKRVFLPGSHGNTSKDILKEKYAELEKEFQDEQSEVYLDVQEEASEKEGTLDVIRPTLSLNTGEDDTLDSILASLVRGLNALPFSPGFDYVTLETYNLPAKALIGIPKEELDDTETVVVLGTLESLKESGISINEQKSKLFTSFDIQDEEFPSIVNFTYGFHDSIVKNIDFKGDYTIIARLAESVRVDKDITDFNSILKNLNSSDIFGIYWTILKSGNSIPIRDLRARIKKLEEQISLANSKEAVSLKRKKDILSSKLSRFSTYTYEVDSENNIVITDDILETIVKSVSQLEIETFAKIEDKFGVSKTSLERFAAYTGNKVFKDIVFPIGNQGDTSRIFDNKGLTYLLANDDEKIRHAIAIDQGLFKLAVFAHAWQIKITTLGIPEMDNPLSEIASRELVLSVKIERAEGSLHWLSGAYKIIGVTHKIDSSNGYITTFDLIKSVGVLEHSSTMVNLQ